jgi:hypothetical protein
LEALQAIAAELLALTAPQLDLAAKDGSLEEISHAREDTR